MTSKTLLSISVTMLTGGVIWHLINVKPPPHIAGTIDPSSSVEPNCNGLRSTLLQLIKDNTDIRDGSRFSFLEMGESARNPAPKHRFSVPLPVKPVKVFGASAEEYKQKLEVLAGRVETACEQAKPGMNSPIYELVKYTLAHLRSDEFGLRGEKRQCTLLIKTDLDEDVQPELRRVIERSIKDPSVAVPSIIAGSLGNQGIDVVFVGTAETKPRAEGRGAVSSLESRTRIWRELFAAPNHVSFRPYCR